jgi:hypothetical protein
MNDDGIVRYCGKEYDALWMSFSDFFLSSVRFISGVASVHRMDVSSLLLPLAAQLYDRVRESTCHPVREGLELELAWGPCPIVNVTYSAGAVDLIAAVMGHLMRCVDCGAQAISLIGRLHSSIAIMNACSLYHTHTAILL